MFADEFGRELARIFQRNILNRSYFATILLRHLALALLPVSALLGTSGASTLLTLLRMVGRTVQWGTASFDPGDLREVLKVTSPGWLVNCCCGLQNRS